MFGGVEFYTHDTSYSGPIVNAYMRAMHIRSGTDHSSADACLQFGTSTATNDVTAMAAMTIITGGDVGIGTDSPQSLLTLESASAPTLTIYEDNNSTGLLGTINFTSNDDGGNITTYGAIQARKDNVTDGGEGGYLRFYAADSSASGASTEHMRIASSGDVILYSGDLIMADGKGINFAAMTSPADAAGMAAETLTDYEEGTWTVTAENGVTLKTSTDLGSYTKVGRLVTCGGQVQVDDDNSTSALVLNLPFITAADLGEGSSKYTGSLRIYNAAVPSSVLWGIVSITAGATTINVQGNKAAAACVPFLATADAYYMFSITYMAA